MAECAGESEAGVVIATGHALGAQLRVYLGCDPNKKTEAKKMNRYKKV